MRLHDAGPHADERIIPQPVQRRAVPLPRQRERIRRVAARYHREHQRRSSPSLAASAESRRAHELSENHGAAMQPAGMSPAVEPGESATFTVVATPGQRLQMETMFVQSNDWFYAFGDGGLSLFDGTTPVSGDVTSRLALYDAGTEADTPPGTGPDQKPAQGPKATDVGPDDSVRRVEMAERRHPSFTIPPTASIIRVTIMPEP